jgi:replicative DNA helicase
VDTLPRQVYAQVRAAMTARGMTSQHMAAIRGVKYSVYPNFKYAPSRSTLSSYAEALDSNELRAWSNSDLFWDRVVAVGLECEEEVFDITVPGAASWLADGIVSHNSGSIEQDSDLILLIYREEFYEPNTTRKGIADIIIAKHRNGPTGEVQMTFLGQYTKFENYAPESYAEGVFRE